jgi:hypothetical protein
MPVGHSHQTPQGASQAPQACSRKAWTPGAFWRGGLGSWPVVFVSYGLRRGSTPVLPLIEKSSVPKPVGLLQNVRVHVLVESVVLHYQRAEGKCESCWGKGGKPKTNGERDV